MNDEAPSCHFQTPARPFDSAMSARQAQLALGLVAAAAAAYLVSTTAFAPHPPAGATGAAVLGDASIMARKSDGRSTGAPPQEAPLMWGADRAVADRICTRNRRFAERASSWERTTFLDERRGEGETTFRDVVTGVPLFVAPRGRDFAAFERESRQHGWPSFRDEEVVWENVRVLEDGETVSVGGTHLGHNLPDGKGNRFCINLACVAGKPATTGQS